MTVPITGALIFIVGLCFFVFSPKLLYAATIISIPFSATVVANVHWGGQEKGVAAWLFLGVLWVLRETLSGRPPWHKSGWFSSRAARNGLFAFLAAVVASWSVPLFLNGTAWVPDPRLMGNQTSALSFSTYDVTQTAYLALGVLLAIFVAAENCSSSRLFYTLKLYAGSCAFAAAWALLQLWCNVTGHAYPAFVFNTSKDISALGYQETLAPTGLNFARVSSVALEPSVLAEELLIALVVLLVCKELRKPLLSRGRNVAAIVLLLAALLVSTSTTAYMGVLLALLLTGVALFRAGRPAKLYFILTGIALLTAILVTMIVPLVRLLGTTMITGKLQTGSGIERLSSIKFAAQDFLRYPILGAGWHTVACWDLVFLLLANTGLIGLITFGCFLIPVIRHLWAWTAKGKPIATVLLPTVVLVVLLSEAAGLTYGAGYDWLVFGLGAGAVVAAREGTQRKIQGTARNPMRKRPHPATAEGTY